MPVIVVGADTPVGTEIVEALIEPDREIRAFVTSASAAEDLKRRGVKVALGDVSDASHVEGASLNCFAAVLIAEAAHDDRERSFADSVETVLLGWADAVRKVQRVIWVTDASVPETTVAETTVVATTDDHRAIATRVAMLDSLDSPGFLEAVSRS